MAAEEHDDTHAHDWPDKMSQAIGSQGKQAKQASKASQQSQPSTRRHIGAECPCAPRSHDRSSDDSDDDSVDHPRGAESESGVDDDERGQRPAVAVQIPAPATTTASARTSEAARRAKLAAPPQCSLRCSRPQTRVARGWGRGRGRGRSARPCQVRAPHAPWRKSRSTRGEA